MRGCLADSWRESIGCVEFVLADEPGQSQRSDVSKSEPASKGNSSTIATASEECQTGNWPHHGALNVLADFPPEEEQQLDNQNNDHHKFQHERAALVELIHHEAIQLFGSTQFLRHQVLDRKSTRLNSSHVSISYAVFCLK